MIKIETTADIGADRRLNVQLPQDVAEGKHQVVVLVLDCPPEDDRAPGESDEDPAQLEWEGDLLVCNNPIPADFDIRRLIELDREERVHRLVRGLR